MEVEPRKVGMGPIASPSTRLLILGSLPGERSLAEQRYYAHPTNQFWRLVGMAIDEPLADLDYPDRLARLSDRGIGLWDVIASARRAGSLDQAIRAPRTNALDAVIKDCPHLIAIAFNGKLASRGGRALLAAPPRPFALIDLPSSSAAFTVPFADKARSWAILSKYSRTKS